MVDENFPPNPPPGGFDSPTFAPGGSGVPTGQWLPPQGPPSAPNGREGPQAGVSKLTLAMFGLALVVLVVASAALVMVVKGQNSDDTDREVATRSQSDPTSPDEADPEPSVTESSTTTVAATSTTKPNAPKTIRKAVTTTSAPMSVPTTLPLAETTVPHSADLQNEDPRVQLAKILDQDRTTANSVIKDRWVAQISSKWEGLEYAGVTWNVAAILAEYQFLDAYYGALLISSSEWGFQRPGIWVTVHDTPFATPEEANSWCDRIGRGPDDCFAKLIHTGPQFSGDTKPRK